MIKKNINRIISIMLIICIICPAYVYADDKEKAWLDAFANQSQPIVEVNYKYGDAKEEFSYMLYMKIPSGASDIIVFNEKNKQYVLKSSDSDEHYTLKVSCAEDTISTSGKIIKTEEGDFYLQMSFGEDVINDAGEVETYSEQRQMKTLKGDLIITLEGENNNYESIIIPKNDIEDNTEKQSGGNDSDGGILGFIRSIGQFLINLVINTVEVLINGVLLRFGDGILHKFCLFIGETVTIERLIFGDVGKVSINFWKNSGTLETDSVASMMKGTVNYWYGVFRGIAIIVYIIVLGYVALKIVLSSTGKGKEKYKTMLKDWVVGVAILFLFPYVMRYTIQLNNTLVKSIQTKYIEVSGDKSKEKIEVLKGSDLAGISEDTYGNNEFYEQMNNGKPITTSNTLLYIRKVAGDKNKIALTAIYYIMITQTIVVMCMYYKRVFMVAFFVTIFPLVAMTYIIDKMGDGKSQSFSIWMKEFVINVVIQTFHAVVFALLTSAGIREYINNDNWLFMLMSVVFLFQGEKILRAIFGAKSATGSISDMATAGMAAYAVAKSLKQFKPQKNEEHKSDLNDIEKSQKILSASSGGGLRASANISNTLASTGMRTSSVTPATGIAKIVTKTGASKIKTGKIIGGALKTGVAAVGAINGLAIGTAKGGNAAEVIGDAYKGKEVGKAIGSLPAAGYKGVANAVKGNRIKKQIQSGAMDSELGLDQELDDKEKEARRAAYAAAAAKAARAGSTAASEKFWKTYNKKSK